MKIAFPLDLDVIEVGRNQRCSLTPVVRSNSGKEERRLPLVVVRGRNRRIADSRVGKGQTDSIQIYAEYTAKAAKGVLEYETVLDYEKWMDDASVVVRSSYVGCACGADGESVDTLGKPLLYAPRLQLTGMMECPVEFEPRNEKRDAFLIYPVNKTVLYADRYNNAAELQKIKDAFEFVNHNPDYEIREVRIMGFASPEGSLVRNIELANGRALSLKNYILQQFPAASGLLKVMPGEENWDGLRKKIEESSMPYKVDLLKIIDSESDLDRREASLKAVGNGQPYRMLLELVYPELRKNTIDISYISKERSLDAARELVFSNPKELNAYEFFNVAENFYKDDSLTYRRVVEAAADTYPDHVVANNNAAYLALRDGDYAAAEKYLERIFKDARSWNNMGCLKWDEGDEREAVYWWKRAADNGDENAKCNLIEIEKRGF